MTILFVFTRLMNIYEINRFRRLSQALVHFVMDRASLFTDHKISGLPIRAKNKHFGTIWEHTCDKSPTDFISSSLKWWSSMHGVDTLKSCWLVLIANSQHRSTHFFKLPSISSSDYEEIRRFCSHRRNSRFEHGSVIVHNIFAYFTLSLSAPQVYMIQERCWF